MNTIKFREEILSTKAFISKQRTLNRNSVCKLRNSWPQSDTYNINLYKTPTNLVLEVKTNKQYKKRRRAANARRRANESKSHDWLRL